MIVAGKGWSYTLPNTGEHLTMAEIVGQEALDPDWERNRRAIESGQLSLKEREYLLRTGTLPKNKLHLLLPASKELTEAEIIAQEALDPDWQWNQSAIESGQLSLDQRRGLLSGRLTLALREQETDQYERSTRF